MPRARRSRPTPRKFPLRKQTKTPTTTVDDRCRLITMNICHTGQLPLGVGPVAMMTVMRMA